MGASPQSFDCTFFAHPQGRNSGDYLHRVLWPAQALSQHLPVCAVQSSHPTHQEAIQKTGILVVNMVADPRLLETIETRNRRGLVTVYEISDDFECFPENLPSHAFYAQNEVQTLIRSLAARATAVQFSSSHLLRKYGSLNSNHALFPNQLSHIPALVERGEKRLALGWAGSVGHLPDAERLAGMLARWPRRAGMLLQTMAAPPVVEVFRKEGLEVQAEPPGDMPAYFTFLEKLDIGIAVIGKDDFSAGRSDGKFLEYASHGAICVCSRAGSYVEAVRDGETGFLFDTEEELFAILDRLAADSVLRRRVRVQAHAYLARQRTHTKAALDRLAFYTSLVAAHPRSLESRSPLSPKDLGFVEAVHPIEASLYQAMTLHGDRRLQEAFALYAKLLEVEPGFFLIWERLRDLCLSLGLKQDAALFAGKAEELYQRGANS